MRKIILILSSILFGGYLLLCLFFYFFQEKFIFNPDKLAPDYEFQIESNYEEIWFEIPDGLKLHGLLFEADTSRSKGLIFFLHGSGGSVNRYIDRIPAYLDLGYDMFLLDYRGYRQWQTNFPETSYL